MIGKSGTLYGESKACFAGHKKKKTAEQVLVVGETRKIANDRAEEECTHSARTCSAR